MAAPSFVPSSPVDQPRAYSSPDHVPVSWKPDRPAELPGRQPSGDRLGYQGPDQGYALTIAEHLAPRVKTLRGETVVDAIRGCLGIALRRASMFGRAPVVHDFNLALTVWGFLDDQPPAELVELRRSVFAGLGNVIHHYTEARDLADSMPEATLRMTPAQVGAAYPARWRELVGR